MRTVFPLCLALLASCAVTVPRGGQQVTPQRPTLSSDTNTTATGTMELEGGVYFDPSDQLSVISQAIDAFERLDAPGQIVRLDNQWPEQGWQQESFDPDSAEDTRAPRDTSPQYQLEEDRLLAEGRG